MPIIRITKKQIDEANKAREAALAKNPEFRLHEERKRLRREAAAAQLTERIKAALEARPVDAINPESLLHEERERTELEAATGREKERRS